MNTQNAKYDQHCGTVILTSQITVQSPLIEHKRERYIKILITIFLKNHCHCQFKKNVFQSIKIKM
jgi:hypothetical protein